MNHVRPVLQVVAALSLVQITFGADSSTCQNPVLSTSSCQGSVLVVASAQLDNAEQQINSMHVNLIYDDIAEALGRIDKAVEGAENLKTQGIYLSRSYHAYVMLAETLAAQAGRQDCYLNYSTPLPENVYSTACTRITFAVRSYVNKLNVIKEDLIRLKLVVTENPPDAQLPLLQSCLSIQASGPRSVRDCLQSYVYDYKVFIKDVTAQVAFDWNRILSAEQCPYYTTLRSKIDDSVALASYDVKQYAEEVLYCAGLSPRALYQQSLNEIDTYISLHNDIVHLQQNVIHEINYADGNFATDVESTIRNYLSPIFSAVELGLLYTTPDKQAQLKIYIANTENEIQNVLSNVSKQLIPTIDKLEAISDALGTIANTLRHAIDVALNEVNSCLPKCIDDYMIKLNEFRRCFTKSLNVVRSILPDVKSEYSTAATQFQPGPDNELNILHLIIDNNYTYIYTYGESTAHEIFNFLGLTMDNSLSGQIVTSMTNDYKNNTTQMTNSTQTVQVEMHNYTEATISRLDSNITTALMPIQNVIKVIQEVKPGVNVSTLNVTYNRLYESLKQNLTDYINNAYCSFSDAIDFQTIFNLTVQAEETKAKLNWCISQNADNVISFDNLDNVTKCFEPYVKNFTAFANNTLEMIRAIVKEVDSLKNTTQSSIVNYTTSALENATAIALGIAETSMAGFNVTPATLEQRTVNQLATFKQMEFSPLLNYIIQLINNLKTNNLVSLVNLTSSVNSSVQPWVYAINICNTTNPRAASNLSSQYPLVNQLINNTLNSVYSTVTPYKQEAVVIEAALTNFTTLLGKTFAVYNSTSLAMRCSSYNTSLLLYTECLDNITKQAKTFITGTLLPDLQVITDNTNNLTEVANTNLTAAIATELNNSNLIAKTEGNKIISTCNVTTDTIQNKSLEQLKSYNITPIYNYAASVRNFADKIVQRSSEMLSLGNYMIYTSTYVMNDAVGSASYVTGWRYTFTNETNFANSVVELARRDCVSLFPNTTQEAYDLYATAANINATLDYEVNLLVPSRLNTKCSPYLDDYYLYYECISGAVDSFGAYYANGLKAAWNASSTAYRMLLNDTAKLNEWKDKVVTPEAAQVVEMLKPLAEKLLMDYNCTVDKLLGYATHIIGQRYAQYKPGILSTATAVYTSANNVLQTNHSNVLDIRPSLLQLLQPLDQFIAVVKNSTNQTVLTEDVLKAPTGFLANASAAFQTFLQNISSQASVIQNNTKAFVDNVEIMYQGLNNTSIYNKCYNSSNTHPLIEMVACYNRLHYDFYVYLEKAHAQLSAYSTLITDLDVNVVAMITNYANNTLLTQFKRNICVYTAILYQVAGRPVPQDLQPCLTVADGRCKVEVIVDGKPKCIIYY